MSVKHQLAPAQGPGYGTDALPQAAILAHLFPPPRASKIKGMTNSTTSTNCGGMQCICYFHLGAGCWPLSCSCRADDIANLIYFNNCVVVRQNISITLSLKRGEHTTKHFMTNVSPPSHKNRKSFPTNNTVIRSTKFVIVWRKICI